ncbi:hypothetical protein ACFY7Z_23130 [Streptomyces sp. NPDC012623]|uniref:hypothetical protein n=1 Tax=unclassified Streptomyces TaxID=2593676 RepID=UPI003693A645
MSSGRKTMTVFVTIILGLILVIVGLLSRWPPWAWPAAAVLLTVVATVTHKILTHESDGFPREFTLDPDMPVPPIQRQEQRVTDVALPSATPDYDFAFCATVRWILLEADHDAPLINPGGLAVDAVLRRARTVAANQQPTRSGLVQHQLEAALGTMQSDPSGRVLAMAQDVSLTLPDPDRARLSRLSDVRKDEDIWEHERNYERNKRAYLGEDVLRDTGSAVVWWLAKNDNQVEGAVDRIGLLASLSAAARNDTVDPTFQHLVPSALPRWSEREYGPEEDPWYADEAGLPSEPGFPGPEPEPSLDTLLDWFGFGPDDADLTLFGTRLVRIAKLHGKTEAAERIRSRLGSPEPEPEPDPKPNEDPDGPPDGEDPSCEG